MRNPLAGPALTHGEHGWPSRAQARGGVSIPATFG
jgi:hypothetical protein